MQMEEATSSSVLLVQSCVQLLDLMIHNCPQMTKLVRGDLGSKESEEYSFMISRKYFRYI